MTKQTSNEISNIMKHDHIRGSRKTANLSRDKKHARRSPLVGFLEADFSSYPKFRDVHPIIYLQRTIKKKTYTSLSYLSSDFQLDTLTMCFFFVIFPYTHLTMLVCDAFEGKFSILTTELSWFASILLRKINF